MNFHPHEEDRVWLKRRCGGAQSFSEPAPGTPRRRRLQPSAPGGLHVQYGGGSAGLGPRVGTSTTTRETSDELMSTGLLTVACAALLEGGERSRPGLRMAPERSCCCEYMMMHISVRLLGWHAVSGWSVQYFDGFAVTVSACECTRKEKCFARRDMFGMRSVWRSSGGIRHRGEPQAAGSGPKGPEGRRFILSRHECVRLWTVGACCVGLGRLPFDNSLGSEAYDHA